MYQKLVKDKYIRVNTRFSRSGPHYTDLLDSMVKVTFASSPRLKVQGGSLQFGIETLLILKSLLGYSIQKNKLCHL